jgi:quinol monooxygenase YgiN
VRSACEETLDTQLSSEAIATSVAIQPGCEALYETGRNDDPHKLVFFEVFSSAAVHEVHLEQDYTKRMFASLDGKMSGVPTLTKLSAL